MKVEWSVFAIEDRDRIFDYIESESPKAAVLVDSRIEEQISRLAPVRPVGPVPGPGCCFVKRRWRCWLHGHCPGATIHWQACVYPPQKPSGDGDWRDPACSGCSRAPHLAETLSVSERGSPDPVSMSVNLLGQMLINPGKTRSMVV